MVIALFLASLNIRPAINSISPLLEMIRSSLGISGSVASLLTAIPVLCMGVFSPIAAKFGGRYGIENVMFGALMLIGLGTFMRLFTSSTAFLLCTAFLTGLGIAVMGPLLSGFIKQRFPDQVARMISVYSAAMTMGAALASGLAAPLQSGMHSWRAALAIWSVLVVVAVPVWWHFVMRRGGRSESRASVQQTAALPWRNPKAWLFILSFGLSGIIFFSITAWLPPIIQSLGYSKAYAGNALTILAVVQIPANLLLPFLIKRYPSRLFLLLLFSCVELIGFVMIYFAFQPLLASGFLGVGAAIIFSLNLLLPMDATSGVAEAASWSAMIQAVSYVMSATGPIMLGWIHDAAGNFLVAVIGLIVINLVAMVVQFFAVSVKKTQKMDVAA
ncbi:CynX/NimT family MFS transporter [Brevibacillus sp. SIMBA_040]|uniref:MFS transporter n=1 Tax=unclassified Brevibacillus TaxID=2684853 RepID=UPI00397DB71A